MAERSWLHDSRRRRNSWRHLVFERLEDRNLLSLTHLYTFNDGLANDWIGNAHATLFNGASVVGGQLVLNNVGVTSGQTSVVQYARMGADLLPSVDATVEVWYTTLDSPDWARVIDIGTQSGGVGTSYLAFTPQSNSADSRAMLLPSGGSERFAAGPTANSGGEHVASMVIDTASGLLRLYLDGSEVGTTPLDGANAGSVADSVAYLGRSLFNTDGGFTGSINEVRIYDDARAPTDIAADAAAGPSTATKSPLVRQMEHLDRGVVAIRNTSTTAYVGWRLLGTDPADIAFNLYRSADGGTPVLLNASPITATTNFVDTTATLSVTNDYFVRPVIGGLEQEASESFRLAANTPVRLFLNVPLQIPPGGTTPSGQNYTYSAHDASVGDLDGDGQYEIVLKWDPSNAKDNSQSGYTGNVYIDAYELDGELLWRIDLGRNMRAGQHYNPFLVYDFDGDGRAEVVMRTAEATIDGTGTVIGNPNADYRNSSGYILTGPEYLTVFEGATGRILDSIPFQPTRGSVASWGDTYGNRVDRFLAAPAYLDGVHPSIVLARGYAGPQSGLNARNEVAAFDYRDGELSFRWIFLAATNGQNPGYVGQTAHAITVGDVDNDGKDEIITGASALDDDGALLYNTGLGHGDALHLADMIPSRPGLEVFMPHEGTGSNGHIGASLRDARTGEIIVGLPVTPTINNEGEEVWPDVGRGVAIDIDPNHPGYELWDSEHVSIYNAQGVAIYNKATGGTGMHTNFGVWWDDDLLRETLDRTTIGDWNYVTAVRENFDLDPATGGTQGFAPNGAFNDTDKKTPSLSADILGDWREEVIWRRSDNTALMIFTTAILADNRFYTLMHDPQYRQAIAWQNGGYNQPPHPSFFFGQGMAAPPVPQIYTVQYVAPLPGDFNGDRRVDAGDYVRWRNHLGDADESALNGAGDGMNGVDQGDYALWKQYYGTGDDQGSGGGSLAANQIFAAGESSDVVPLTDQSAELFALQPLSLTALKTPMPTRHGGLAPRSSGSNSDASTDLLLLARSTTPDDDLRDSWAADRKADPDDRSDGPGIESWDAALADFLPTSRWSDF